MNKRLFGWIVVCMKKKKLKNNKTMEKITQVFELPTEVLGSSRMVLSGNSNLFIENHEGICKYTLTEICVRVPGLIVCICGKELILKAMGKENLIVYGDISDIKFEPERRETC